MQKLGLKHFQFFFISPQGYFTDGVYPDEKNLLRMAAQVGLDEDGAKAALRDPAKNEHVKNVAQSWSSKGVTGEYSTGLCHSLSHTQSFSSE